MKTIPLLLIALLLPVSAFAKSYQLVVQFLYPYGSVRGFVLELPIIPLSVNKPVKRDYKTEDKLTKWIWQQHLEAALTPGKEDAVYRLTFSYAQSATRNGIDADDHWTYKFSTEGITPDYDQVLFLDPGHPEKGLVRIKFESK